MKQLLKIMLYTCLFMSGYSVAMDSKTEVLGMSLTGKYKDQIGSQVKHTDGHDYTIFKYWDCLYAYREYKATTALDTHHCKCAPGDELIDVVFRVGDAHCTKQTLRKDKFVCICEVANTIEKIKNQLQINLGVAVALGGTWLSGADKEEFEQSYNSQAQNLEDSIRCEFQFLGTNYTDGIVGNLKKLNVEIAERIKIKKRNYYAPRIAAVAVICAGACVSMYKLYKRVFGKKEAEKSDIAHDEDAQYNDVTINDK